MVKHIDMTPTWGAVVPWITAGLEAGGTAHSSALQEMYRMADAADKWNAAAPDMLAALEEIESLPVDDYGCREIPPGFLDAARAAIAKAKGASDAD